MAKEDPSNATVAYDLMSGEVCLAEAQLELGENAEVVTRLRSVIAAQNGRTPDVLGRRRLAVGRRALAVAFSRTGQHEESLRAAQQSLAELTALAHETGGLGEELDRCESSLVLAEEPAEQRQLAKALAVMGPMTRALDALFAKTPTSRARSDTVSAWLALGTMEAAAGDRGSARAAWQRVITIIGDTRELQPRQVSALAYAHLGALGDPESRAKSELLVAELRRIRPRSPTFEKSLADIH